MLFEHNLSDVLGGFLVGALWLTVAILVGLSRIVLNEHYLSDVLGGFLVGALWLTVAISVTEWFSSRAKITWQIPWSAAQIYLLWFSVACVLIAALIYAQRYQFPLLL